MCVADGDHGCPASRRTRPLGGEGARPTKVPRVRQEPRSPQRWPEGQMLGAEGRLGTLISSERARRVSSRWEEGCRGEGTEELREPGTLHPARAARLQCPAQRRVSTWLPHRLLGAVPCSESRPGLAFSWGIWCDFEHVVGFSVSVSSPVNQG